ncbi:hypothetical protein [Facklamia miroungae]|uniref:Uncharacterized protein n=1 Tax=Facklamia miroungae TaxID=120956 RepID=A0A1G7RU20_9LACT|nr:hypothetical protein [Facklamia miroungae]NKZ29271.1 hypothetical protein [Facklamia miroungae]SDG14327.1 hypothetical protein SAMN05421791_103181 [Facklamia miroungae]
MRDLQLKEDLFFISEIFLKEHKYRMANQLILSVKEYQKHSDYHTVNNISNHRSWTLKCDFVLVAPPGWYESQDQHFQKELFNEVKKNGSFLIDEQQIITSNYWRHLDQQSKRRWIETEDESLSLTDIDEIENYEYLKKYHNIFPNNHGPNCFAACLYAITKNEFILDQWVWQETFLQTLSRNNYRRVKDNYFQAKDVICFLKEDHLIHTCFVLNKAYCFNKNGQTFHEPWKIVDLSEVFQTFSDSKYSIYRKSQ